MKITQNLFSNFFAFYSFTSSAILARGAIPPLTTAKNLILDKYLNPIHLHCTSWSGAHMEDYLTNGLEFSPLVKLVDFIRLAKFNCVRLQFSAEMVHKNPVINPKFLSEYNSDLVGIRAMELYHRIIQEITSRKMMVILDYHMLDAKWCCDQYDDNGGWSNDRWTEQNATAQLLKIVNMEKDNPYVIGVDLRNEIRPRIVQNRIFNLFYFPSIPFYPNWGNGGDQDWAAAAERFGNAVHTVNPNLLIFIQGIFIFQLQHIIHLFLGGHLHALKIPQSLKSVSWRPITLNVPHKIVYSSHEYVWHYQFDWSRPVHYDDYKSQAEANYGFLFDNYPLWIGEMGTSADANGVDNNQHWQYMIRYFQERKFHWAVWEFAGVERGHADPNLFAVMNRNHTGFSYSPYIQSLQSIMY